MFHSFSIHTMASHNFSGNYMVLRPEETKFYEIFRILWDPELEKRAFVVYPAGKEENLRRRWLIFLSLLGQKILQSCAKPMAWFGSKFEMWLNLLSSNKNIFVLLLNFLRGSLVKPDRTSATFLSFCGNIDKRVQLDNCIKPGDSKYYAALCAMASKIAYENKAFVESTVRDHWKMELLGYYDFWNDFQKKRTTQGFMFHDKNADPDIIIVAFRGTEAFDADSWCTDVDISWYELTGMGKIHGGFMKALGLLMNRGWPKDVQQPNDCPLAYYTIREKLKQHLMQNSKTKFILTGHSQGGALAILFPAVLALHEETLLLKRLEGVYTFGQPRVGDEEFKGFMKKLLQKYGFRYLRFVYCNDVIPRLPTDDSNFLFKHFGTCLYYNSCYKGKIVREEPHKNYFSPLAPIPRMLNAFWELIRSFIIPYTRGSDYKETWLLRLIRFVGLALPGLAAHNPQDYINLTRLGSDAIYLQVQDPQFRSVLSLGRPQD